MPPRPPNEQNPKHLPPCILAPVGHQRHQGPFFDLSRSRRSFPAVSTGRDTEIDQDHRAINATQAPNDAERLAAWMPLSGVPPSRPYDSGPRRRGEFLSHAKGMKDKYPSTNRRVTAPPSPAKGEDLILAPCTGHHRAPASAIVRWRVVAQVACRTAPVFFRSSPFRNRQGLHFSLFPSPALFIDQLRKPLSLPPTPSTAAAAPRHVQYRHLPGCASG